MANPFLINLKFILRAHVLNPLWRERNKRRNVRCYHCYKRVEALLDKYRDFVSNLKLQSSEGVDNGGNDKIFSIWFQGRENAPKLVKVCMKRLENLYGERYMVLDENDLTEMLDIPDFITEKRKAGVISAAHFSDICRIELLYKFGGMWFDATDYITEPVPQWIEESDLFIYACGDVITPHKLIQSCFMRAARNHPLMGAMREFLYEYWRNEKKLADYFLLHYMMRFLVENNEEAARLFNAMPAIHQDPTHQLWHKNRDKPYSDALYLESTKGTFFQKTTFKCKSATDPKPGSVADYIINEKITIPYGHTRLPDSRS